jgi:arabinose-5-phosphate isomerase
LVAQLDEHFAAVVELLYACQGRVIVSGIGKSGLIARKIVATLASTGTPALFLHPTEALHGDLGMLRAEDCLIAISYSGEADELLQLVPHIRRLGLPLIALVGQRQSTLARHADWILSVQVQQEASDLEAAPMASTTATLAMGDALAAALIERRQFKSNDFAKNHPGGSLGRRLLTQVKDVMRRHELPQAPLHTPIQELLLRMSAGKLGMVAVLDEQARVVGIITDGDVRRALNRYPDEQFFRLKAQDLMNTQPKTIAAQASLFEAEKVLQEHQIQCLLVLEEGKLQGILPRSVV